MPVGLAVPEKSEDFIKAWQRPALFLRKKYDFDCHHVLAGRSQIFFPTPQDPPVLKTLAPPVWRPRDFHANMASGPVNEEAQGVQNRRACWKRGGQELVAAVPITESGILKVHHISLCSDQPSNWSG